jgi:putative flippase GtrA
MHTDRAAPARKPFVRSALAGAAATIADLAVLGLAVGLGIDPRVANVPALLVGATVQFVGNRHWAFDAARGGLRRQLGLFVLAEIVTLALNGVLFDAVARFVVLGAIGALVTRTIASSAVYLGWSYPVWKRIFVADASETEQGAGLVEIGDDVG